MNQSRIPKQKKHDRERGAVLIVVLLVTLALLVLSMPFLAKLSGQYRVSEGSYKSLAALSLSEAGVERAIWELNYGDIETWAGDSMNRLLNRSSVQSSEGAVLGDIVVSISELDGDNPVVESTGQIDYVDDLAIERTTRIVLQKLGGDPLFDVGVFALESVTLAANLHRWSVSSTAVLPPPIDTTDLPLKNGASHVPQ